MSEEVVVKKRKKRSGSRKGFPFEREMCKAFSQWWCGGEDQDIFWRTAQSGGRATTRRKAGKNTNSHYGDVCAIDPSGDPFMRLFTIDLKRGYPKTNFQDFVYGARPAKPEESWECWIEDAVKDSFGAKTWSWMVVHRQDHKNAIVVMPHKIISELFDNRPSALMRVDYQKKEDWGEASMCVACFTLDEFFRCLRPNKVRAWDLERRP